MPRCSVKNMCGSVVWAGQSQQLSIDNCRIPESTKKIVKNCIDSLYTSVYFIAESHTRFNFYYILYKMGILDPLSPQLFNKELIVGKYHFININSVETLAYTLEKLLTILSHGHDKSKYLVIFNAGTSWNTFLSYIQNFTQVTEYNTRIQRIQ